MATVRIIMGGAIINAPDFSGNNLCSVVYLKDESKRMKETR